jgi:pimeloyl-ACP methyl ester carboxylesterase
VTRARRIFLLGGLPLFVVPFFVREAPPVPDGAWPRSAGLSERWLSVAGVRVRYVRSGAGPTLVLLHGFGSSIYTWKDVLDLLSRDHDVIALDFPGFGGSDRPADLHWRSYPRVVRALVDALGIERFSVAGNSMGGAVAVLVASAGGDRVDALVLIDSAGYNFAPAERPFALRLLGSPVGPVADLLPVRRLVTRAALRQVFFDASKVGPERVEAYAAPFFRPGALSSARSLLASIDGGGAADFDAAVAALRARTLIVWGREDAWVPLAHAERFAAAIPGARKVVLERCGHLPQEERPAETAAVIREFLGAH